MTARDTARTWGCPHLSRLDRMDGLRCPCDDDHARRDQIESDSAASALAVVVGAVTLTAVVVLLWLLIPDPIHLIASVYLLCALAWAVSVLAAAGIDHHRSRTRPKDRR